MPETPTARAPTPAVVCVYGLGVNGLGLVRSLARAGVPTYVVGVEGERNLAAASRYCRRTVNAERMTGDALAAALIGLADELGEQPVLFFDNDKMMIALAPHAEAITARFHSTAPLARIVELTDKIRQMESARGAGLAVPRAWYPESWQALREIGAEFAGPVIAKPSPAHFGADRLPFKVVVRANAAALADYLEGYVDSPRGLIVQRVVEGRDDSVYIGAGYRSPGGADTRIVTGRKLHQAPRGAGIMAVGRTLDNPEVRAASLALVEALDYEGIFATEFKYAAEEGRYYFVEINPRAPQFNTLCRRAGLDLALAAYRGATAPETLSDSSLDVSGDSHWIYVGAVANAVLSDRSFESLLDSMKLVFARPEWAVWSLRDPRPWWLATKSLTALVTRRITGKLAGRRHERA